MATQSPFQMSAAQSEAVPTSAAASKAKDVQPGTAKEPAKPSMDLYRTFSPSEVAFWDLRCAPNKAGASGASANASNGSGSWSSWFGLGGLFGK